MLLILTKSDVDRLIALADKVRTPPAPEDDPDVLVSSRADDRDLIELRDVIERLDSKAQEELLVLMYVGRGDFAPTDNKAIADAKRQIGTRFAAQMMEKSGALSTYWRNGLVIVSKP